MFQFRSCSGVFPEYAEVPPRVEYELTSLGKSLLQQILELAQWSSGSMDEIVKARMEYDSRLQ